MSIARLRIRLKNFTISPRFYKRQSVTLQLSCFLSNILTFYLRSVNCSQHTMHFLYAIYCNRMSAFFVDRTLYILMDGCGRTRSTRTYEYYIFYYATARFINSWWSVAKWVRLKANIIIIYLSLYIYMWITLWWVVV